jgi:hypothetical protein
MFSSRKQSVKRHIVNIHDGMGWIVSYIDYLTGRFAGYYTPRSPPLDVSATKKNTEDKVKDIPRKPTMFDLVSEGFCREFGALMARKNINLS